MGVGKSLRPSELEKPQTRNGRHHGREKGKQSGNQKRPLSCPLVFALQLHYHQDRLMVRKLPLGSGSVKVPQAPLIALNDDRYDSDLDILVHCGTKGQEGLRTGMVGHQ